MADPEHPAPMPETSAARLLAAVSADRDARLTDYERAATTAMASALVDEAASLFADRLGPDWTGGRATPKILGRDAQLIALLRRRAAEHRIMVARGDRGCPALASLGRDADGAVATAARALLAEASGRLDRFHDPRLPLCDLPGEVHAWLVWAVAAAGRPDDADAATDRRIAATAAAIVQAHDETAMHESRAATLVRLLDAAARLDDDAIADLAEAAPVAMPVAALAACAGIAIDGAWEMLLDRSGARLALLLRAGDLAAGAALRVMRACTPAADAATLIASTWTIDVARAHDALRLWRLDPAYRAAIGTRTR